ncbi:LLM class F420-dependent oxidoreductase [Sporichthya brevicatena]|uniref:LLM class F420-dependent oxidoreductase n=2 Tax=Sporichthya brevicatena TaxID=171442 RepID=A0ABN1GZN2_9ACTN
MAVVEPDSLVDFARRAETAGCDSVWVPEHLIWPATITSPYPYKDGGGPPVPSSVNLYDPWALLSAVAAVTTTIRLGTCVYVLPLRDPLVTARAVATLDVLSNGRAILGAGLGWMKEEFDAAGIDFRTRASRSDEIVPVLRSLWSQELTRASGRHINFEPLYFYPKPPQGASLPIVFGGDSEPALRRAARLGDGWLGTWCTPTSTRAYVTRLEELLTEYGRADEPFEVTVMIKPREVSVDLIEELHAAGADRICIGSPTVPLAVWPEILDNLAVVLAKLRGDSAAR